MKKKLFDFILSFDPSGNFKEGKGTSGVVYFDSKNNKVLETFNISAKKFNTTYEYYQAHIELIKEKTERDKSVLIVIEEFVLYPEKAKQQSYSKMETSKLIGVLQNFCEANKIVYYMQQASEIKRRWAEKILIYKGYLTKQNNFYYIKDIQGPTSRHIRDALKHALHVHYFKNNIEKLKECMYEG